MRRLPPVPPAIVATALPVLVAVLVLPGCRSAGRGPVAAVSPRAPLVVEVLDRHRARPDDSWRFADRVNELIDAAVQARTGADFPLDGWASLAGDGRITVVAVPGPGALARAVADRLRLALGEAEAVSVVDAGHATAVLPGAFVLVSTPAISRGGEVRDDGAAVAARLRDAGWPAPALVLADLSAPAVGDRRWDARELLVGTDPAAVAAVARWQLRGRLAGSLPPPERAPRVRLEVLPVGD